MTQTFVESCIDFEVAHLSTLIVRRLPYPEFPTLSNHKRDTEKHAITEQGRWKHLRVGQAQSRRTLARVQFINIH